MACYHNPIGSGTALSLASIPSRMTQAMPPFLRVPVIRSDHRFPSSNIAPDLGVSLEFLVLLAKTSEKNTKLYVTRYVCASGRLTL